MTIASEVFAQSAPILMGVAAMYAITRIKLRKSRIRIFFDSERMRIGGIGNLPQETNQRQARLLLYKYDELLVNGIFVPIQKAKEIDALALRSLNLVDIDALGALEKHINSRSGPKITVVLQDKMELIGKTMAAGRDSSLLILLMSDYSMQTVVI